MWIWTGRDGQAAFRRTVSGVNALGAFIEDASHQLSSSGMVGYRVLYAFGFITNAASRAEENVPNVHSW